MSYETKIFLLTIAGSIILAAAYLHIQDLLYTRARDDPLLNASETVLRDGIAL